MDAWQTAQHTKTRLEALTWNHDSEKLVRQADISALTPEGILEVRSTPCALIVITDSTPIPQRQAEVYQNFEITLAYQVYGDQVVTASIMGKDRGDGADGYGILEADAIMLEDLSLMTEQDGMEFLFLGAGTAQINYIGEGDDIQGNIVSRTSRFEARCTEQRTYASPTFLRFTGNVDLTWSLPGSRFDLKKIVLRRSADGGIAPATIDDGVGVTLGSDLATSVSDGPLSSGTFIYSVFAQYDDNLAGVVANYNTSPPYTWKVTV